MKFSTILLALALALFQGEAIAKVLNGKVLLVKGIVSATDTEGKNRLLAKGQTVFVGDRISTTQKSFNLTKLKVLNLDRSYLTPKGIRALLNAPIVGQLEH
ncbi:MAG: hypothetical protein AAF402_10210, partial [Pseudomonadota bacterium]